MAVRKFRKGTYNKYFKRKMAGKRKATRTKKMSFAKRVKRIVMKATEPKVKRAYFGKVELYHNCFYSGTPVSTGFVALLNDAGIMPQQGIRDDQRVGDQINLSSFYLRMVIGQKADRPNITFRWWVLQIPKGSPVNGANWFITTSSNVMLDDPNTDFVKVIRSGYIRPNQASLAATGGREYTFVKRVRVPYKKMVKFGPADAATTHNDNDLYFCLVCYDAFGSLPTDNIAYVTATIDINYRDP